MRVKALENPENLPMELRFDSHAVIGDRKTPEILFAAVDET